MSWKQEILQEIGRLQPQKGDSRKLGLAFLVLLNLIGGFLLWRSKPAALYFMLAGGVLGLWGLVFPQSFKIIYKIWMTFALLLGSFMTRAILITVFYLVITPIGICMRVLGKDPLDGGLGKGKSYWRMREPGLYDPRRSEKMY
ncbi:MAG: SxtJ family membrane protein [Thermodesulfobacteriota bacterium]